MDMADCFPPAALQAEEVQEDILPPFPIATPLPPSPPSTPLMPLPPQTKLDDPSEST